ncbi:hypothetical protein Dimus_035795 [Dionaea muscipula]
MGKPFQEKRAGHVDLCKGILYENVVIRLKKKDVVKSKVRGVEMEFNHEKLATILGSGENRRRDDDVDAPEEEEDEGNKDEFGWEAVIDEATRVRLGEGTGKLRVDPRVLARNSEVCDDSTSEFERRETIDSRRFGEGKGENARLSLTPLKLNRDQPLDFLA